MKKTLLIITALTVAFLASCDGLPSSQTSSPSSDETSQTSSVITSYLRFKDDNVDSIELDQSIKLTVEYDVNAMVNLVFSSSQPLICSVDDEGTIKGLALGEAVITVKDTYSNLEDSINIEVIAPLPEFTSSDQIVSFIRKTSVLKESSIGEISHVETSKNDYYDGTETITIKNYDGDALIRENEETYTSWGNENRSSSTDARIIQDDKYYDLTLDNTGGYSYASVYSIVDFPDGSSSQIELTEAKERVSSFNVFGDIANDIVSLNKTKETIEITKETNQLVKVNGEYLNQWLGDPTKSDYETFNYSLEFKNDGTILSFTLESYTYSDDSYDLINNCLKEDATITSQTSIKIEVTNETLLPMEEMNIVPTDYFVSEIIEANYNTNNQISIGSTLSTYNFNITKYSPSTALDSEDFSIINVENEPGGQQIVEDPIWGYEAQSEGIAKVTIAMDNNPSVTYTIEITVVR